MRYFLLGVIATVLLTEGYSRYVKKRSTPKVVRNDPDFRVEFERQLTLNRITNLLVDMHENKAPATEITKVISYSMVVMDMNSTPSVWAKAAKSFGIHEFVQNYQS